MSKNFHIAVGLYLLSFFLPTLFLIENEITIYGWETALDVIMNQNNSYSISENEGLITVQYIVMNLANPLILVVIIMAYTKSKSKRLMWTLGSIALLSAIIYMPFFFTMIFTYFSFGYYLWIISILLIYLYSNEGTFKRPPKKKDSPSK